MQQLTNPKKATRFSWVVVVSIVISLLDLFLMHAAVLSLLFFLFGSITAVAWLVRRRNADAYSLLLAAILIFSAEYLGSRITNLQVSRAASGFKDEVNAQRKSLGRYPSAGDPAVVGRKKLGYPMRYVFTPDGSGGPYILYDTFNFQRDELDIRSYGCSASRCHVGCKGLGEL